jgi:hypothetical protein
MPSPTPSSLPSQGVIMATSPVPQWAREMSPEHHGPTGAGVRVTGMATADDWHTFRAWQRGEHVEAGR